MKNKIKLKLGPLNSQKLSRQLSKFIVTDLHANTTHDMVYLIIDVKRLSGPFWMSLFIPSICLILAAEITLFVDESHFEALIMVALTSNLVMYTMYSSILEKMPEDSTLKHIDIWLLHGLLMPMVVFVVLVANKILHTGSDKSEPSLTSIKVGNSMVKVGAKFRNGAENENKSSKIKSSTCITFCKFLIPISSVLFIITFFVICLVNI